MLPRAFVKGYDRRRLRNLLVFLFVALSIPTGIVIWQAFDQLKWEAWYQYRTQAESLTARVDAELSAAITAADARRFSDYSFVTASSAANVVQRSPLSLYPVEEDIPGTIGYFQIAPDGQFSTPLLPVDGMQSSTTGLSEAELVARQNAAGYITQVLADNALVSARAEAAGRTDAQLEIEEIIVTGSRIAAETADLEVEGEIDESVSAGALSSAAEPFRDMSVSNSPTEYSLQQSVFDQAVDALKESAEADAADDAPARANSLGKVGDLQLDDPLERKNEGVF